MPGFSRVAAMNLLHPLTKAASEGLVTALLKMTANSNAEMSISSARLDQNIYILLNLYNQQL